MFDFFYCQLGYLVHIDQPLLFRIYQVWSGLFDLYFPPLGLASQTWNHFLDMYSYLFDPGIWKNLKRRGKALFYFDLDLTLLQNSGMELRLEFFSGFPEFCRSFLWILVRKRLSRWRQKNIQQLFFSIFFISYILKCFNCTNYSIIIIFYILSTEPLFLFLFALFMDFIFLGKQVVILCDRGTTHC